MTLVPSCEGTITDEVVGQLLHNIFRDVRVSDRAHTCAFLVELDHAGFEETLDGVECARPFSQWNLVSRMSAYHRSEDDLVIRPETVFLGRLARSAHDEVVQVQSDVSLSRRQI